MNVDPNTMSSTLPKKRRIEPTVTDTGCDAAPGIIASVANANEGDDAIVAVVTCVLDTVTANVGNEGEMDTVMDTPVLSTDTAVEVVPDAPVVSTDAAVQVVPDAPVVSTDMAVSQVAGTETDSMQIKAAIDALAKSMHDPVLSLLAAAECIVYEGEYDRWFRMDGFTNMPAANMEEIAARLLDLAILRKVQATTAAVV